MQWEYMITYCDKDLSKMGKSGWELISVIPYKKGIKMYFKRVVQNLSERITSEQREEIFKGINTSEKK